METLPEFHLLETDADLHQSKDTKLKKITVNYLQHLQASFILIMNNLNSINGNRHQKRIYFFCQNDHKLTGDVIKAGSVKFANVELKADDGKHENGKEEQQPNLQQGNHGLHDGFEHHL